MYATRRSVWLLATIVVSPTIMSPAWAAAPEELQTSLSTGPGAQTQADAVSGSEPYTSIFDDTDPDGRVERGAATKIHRTVARRLEEAPPDQAVKAWVLFRDKALTSRADYNSAIDATAATYNRRAIERRIKRRTSPGLFDEYDVPVVPAYITQVEATGARVHVVSKWVNGVSVYATKAQFERIEQLPFVKTMQAVRRSQRIEPVRERQLKVEANDGPISRAATGGGETCALATVIPGIPYNDAGTTVGATDDYGETCPSSSNSPDVVYSYTPGDDVTVDIRLCNGTDYGTTMYVYESVCPDGGPFACAERCASPAGWLGSIFFDLTLTGGNTYYMVIDGAGGEEGNYVLGITESTVYGRSHEQLEQINLIAVHDRGFTGSDVIVGVLDTGFWTTHEAFNDPAHPLNIVAAWDFVDGEADPAPGWHGTAVLSTIGAYKPNKLIGGAYDASFILCRTEDVSAEYRGEEDNYVAGLEFIEANGGDMATSSLGYLEFDDPAESYTQADLDGLTAICTIGTNVATANGVHCLTSVGNSGHDADPGTSHFGAPSDALDVIAVGAVYGTGGIVEFSSDGPTADGRVKPEVLALGYATRMVSPNDDTAYYAASGTSFAAPLAAAAVACLIDAHPDWTVDTMRQSLFETADYYVANGTYDPEYVLGYGIIDALAALGCGNGTGEAGEECDDGNTDSGDGCSPSCAVESGWECTGEPSECTFTCGDNVIDTHEECDDGNTDDGDGCDATCTNEICGNGVVQAGAGEDCDDGNTTPGDGCSSTCTVEDGWECVGNPSMCTPVCDPPCVHGTCVATDICSCDAGWTGQTCSESLCGDGLIVGSEQCDDANNDADDGCSPGCAVESGWDCTGEPSECVKTVNPLLPAPPPYSFRKNRYVAFDSNNAGAVVIQVQVAQLACEVSGDDCSYDEDCPDFASGEGCLTPSGFDPVSSEADPEWEAVGWLGEPCTITPGTQVPADTWHSMVVSDMPALPGFEYTDPDTGDPLSPVFVGDCEIMPRFSYGLRASVNGSTFSERLIVGTIREPVKNGKKWADVVGQRDADTGEYTEPNLRINVDDVQVMIVFLNNKDYRPHLTVLDLSHEAPGYKINADDLQMVMRAFGITEDYPPLKFIVEASGAVHPRDCPFDAATTTHDKCE